MNQVTNLFDSQNQIVDLLKTAMPTMTDRIFPVFEESMLKQSANLQQSIHVAYYQMPVGETTQFGNFENVDLLYAVLIMLRDARGANFTLHAQAGEMMIQVIEALKGKKLTGHSSVIRRASTERHYRLYDESGKDTGAVIYPLIFKTTFVI